MFVAEVTLESDGRARIRAKKTGAFGVVMFTPYTGQTPAGALVNPLWVCPGVQPSISTIRVMGA